VRLRKVVPGRVRWRLNVKIGPLMDEQLLEWV
jgi:hypothetical protein